MFLTYFNSKRSQSGPEIDLLPHLKSSFAQLHELRRSVQEVVPQHSTILVLPEGVEVVDAHLPRITCRKSSKNIENHRKSMKKR